MAQTRPITADEFLAMGRSWCELIRGEIVEVTPTGRLHGRVTARIGRIVDEFVESAGLGEAVTGEPGFKLESNPDMVRAPDVAFVRGDRLDGVHEQKYYPFAPDLAVEVVSPNDAFSAVEEKAAMWLSYGTRLVWVVEPELRKVFVYRPDAPREDLADGDDISGGEVLPGFSAEVSRFFP